MNLFIRMRWIAFSSAGVMVVAVTLIHALAALSWAQGKGGGGNGNSGGNQRAYLITRFLPPDSNATSSFVQAINDTGDAVGYLEYADGRQVPVHLNAQSNTYTTLARLVYPFDVNNSGQIVGSDANCGLFLESHLDLDPTVLPPLADDDASIAYGINDYGITIGSSLQLVADGDLRETAVVWSVSHDVSGNVVVKGPVELPPLDPGSPFYLQVRDINEVIFNADGNPIAQVVGESSGKAAMWSIEFDMETGQFQQPIIREMVNVPNTGYALGNGVNNFGEVCGQSVNDPFLTRAMGTTERLSVPPRTLFATAIDINDTREVVGYVEVGRYRPGRKSAFLWKDGRAIDLINQLASESGWESLSAATVVNNHGDIGGYGQINGGTFGFIMSPTSH